MNLNLWYLSLGLGIPLAAAFMYFILGLGQVTTVGEVWNQGKGKKLIYLYGGLYLALITPLQHVVLGILIVKNIIVFLSVIKEPDWYPETWVPVNPIRLWCLIELALVSVAYIVGLSP